MTISIITIIDSHQRDQPMHRSSLYTLRTIHSLTMSSTDSIVNRLFARPTLPPLEPGTTLYAPELAPKISKLDEHRYVVAGKYPLQCGTGGAGWRGNISSTASRYTY
jgi:hypothetical protein